jgi:Carboxypeptidase regulatory-like domain/TonB dependent receptor
MNRILSGFFRCEFRSSIKIVNALGVIAFLLFCVPVFAQLNLGRLYGGVTDQTGGAVAGTLVTVTDVERGVSRALTADTSGEYNAPSLTPGTYTVRAEAKGFQTIQRENVIVGVGQEIRVDLTLRTGEQTQTVTVTEAIPIINTTSSELGGRIESRDLGDLPMNGRSYAKLLNFTPGAVSINGNDTFYNGVRYTQNEWMFDGIDDLNDANTGPMIGGTSGFTEATILPADAIQEVHLATNGKAEYGWKPGGAINIGIKSGTNRLHGTAFGMGRNSALEATDPFAQGTPSPDQITQQGATLGGAIKKDKLFFFTAYEGQSFHLQSSSTDQVPASLASAAGTDATDNVPDALFDIYRNANNLGKLPVSQLSLDMMGCQASPAAIQTAANNNAANAAAGAKAIEGLCYPGGAGSIVSIYNNPTSSINSTVSPSSYGGSQNGLGKLDYHLSDHNLINGEFFFGQGPMIQAAGTEVQPYWATARWTRTQAIRTVWTYLPNSNWVNEARIGYDRQNKSSIPADCFGNLGQPNYATQYHLVTGVTTPLVPLGPGCAFPGLTVGNFAILGGNTGSGAQANTIHHIAGIDSVSYTRGNHQFKFGVEIHRNHLDGASKLANGSGTLSFGSIAGFKGDTALEEFLTGTVSSSALLVGNALVSSTWPRYALFGQDDWRLTSKLTLNFGLRWEIIPAPNESNNKIGTFDPSLGIVQVGSQLPALYPTKYNEFEPRVGFAYDLNGKGTTVVRGGFGIGYAFNNFNEYLSVSQGAASNTVPTGWNLYTANGTLIAKPGNMVAGNLTAPNGTLVTWLPDAPIFNQNDSLLACGNGLSPINPGTAVSAANPGNPQPCDIQVVNTNLKAGYVESWNLSVQHAFGSNLALTVAYVGTHGANLNGLLDSNLPVPGIKNTSSSPGNENEQLQRPYTRNCPATVPGGLGLNPNQCFPYLGKVYVYGQNGWSNYHGLQTSLQQRITHGLFFTATYTFSHALDTSSADFGSPIMNSTCVACDYGRSSFDFRHNFTLRLAYNVPGIKRVPGQLLEGWQVSSALTVLSSQPLPGTDTSSDLSGTGQKLDRWSIGGDPSNIQTGFGVPCYGVTGSSFAKAGTGCNVVSAVANLPQACIDTAGSEATNPAVVAAGAANSTGLAALASFGCYYQNGTAIVPPAQGTFGNMGRDVLSNGVPFREWDAAISKTWRFGEVMSAQFRTEVFNVTNSVIYQLPKSNPNSVTSFGFSQALGRSGDPILGSGGPRQITLSLKISF